MMKIVCNQAYYGSSFIFKKGSSAYFKCGNDCKLEGNVYLEVEHIDVCLKKKKEGKEIKDQRFLNMIVEMESC